MDLFKWKFSYPVTVLILLLLMTDAGFILVHVLRKLGYINSGYFNLSQDMGYAEVFQYMKEFWIASLLVIIALRDKAASFVVWSLIFLYMLADDSLKVHENGGRYLVEALNIQPALSLRAQDFGELLVTAIAGGILFSMLFVTYYFASQAARHITHKLLLGVAGLAFFGILIDMLHSALPFGNFIFGLIEDSGEMLTMSLIVGYCFALMYSQAHNQQRVPSSA
ncbi:hypothetical protein IT774_00240 [Salinimonas marina]|uniref:Uncharacterized protein n=1 Tax=Salinimonas marina TaxID=2785918 RepID=A0A7S9DXR6_9ALTE|nr:hypothetical protein [Salinimonas marina]QPG05762.1 hypothetical protein IT774_00240 [Salinimonas marina]